MLPTVFDGISWLTALLLNCRLALVVVDATLKLLIAAFSVSLFLI